MELGCTTLLYCASSFNIFCFTGFIGNYILDYHLNMSNLQFYVPTSLLPYTPTELSISHEKVQVQVLDYHPLPLLD